MTTKARQQGSTGGAPERTERDGGAVTYTYPAERPKHVDINGIMERYRDPTTDLEHARSLLRSIGELPITFQPDEDHARTLAVSFLCDVGDEYDVHEPNADLRKEARSVLYRYGLQRWLSSLAPKHFGDLEERDWRPSEMTVRVLKFLVRGPKHTSYITGRDADMLRQWIAQCVWDGRMAKPEKRNATAYAMAVKALVESRSYDWIREKCLHDAIPYLYAVIRENLSVHTELVELTDPETLVTRCGPHAVTDIARMLTACGSVMTAFSIGGATLTTHSHAAQTLLALIASRMQSLGYVIVPELAHKATSTT